MPPPPPLPPPASGHPSSLDSASVCQCSCLLARITLRVRISSSFSPSPKCLNLLICMHTIIHEYPPHDFMLLRKCLFMFFCWKLNRTPCGRQLTGDCIKECIQMKGNRFAKIHYYTWRERTDRALPMKQCLPPSHLRNFCAIPLELHASHTCVKNT